MTDQTTLDATAAPDDEPTTDLADGADGTADADADVTAIAAAVVEDAPAPEELEQQTFADYGVQPQIVEALAGAGIVHPFPIQSMTLPVALAGHDIIGQAKTGTGKTLGFGIPMLQRVFGPGEPGWDELAEPGKPQALAVAPTRELAVQVARDIERAASRRGARVLTVYGGRAYEPQVEALQRGVEIVVGTPGRLLDLAQQGHLSLAATRIVVLDEADEMLDLGFLPDVEKLLAMTPAGRQTMLFSATMPGAVVALARRYMTQPTHIRAADPDDDGATVKAITQFAYRAHAMDKVEVLARLLQSEGRGLSIVFARTKRTAAKVADDLVERGFAAAPLHGDLGQGAREQALRAFRNGKVDVLVATDVAARGIDVTDVTHVVNYQCPEDEKTYLHRIGRTGRAGATGTAVTFVDWDDLHRWAMIDRGLALGMPEPVETYSTSPHLFADLHIPAGTKGTLPRGSRTRAGLGAEEVEDLGETGRRNAAPRRGEDRGGRSGPARGDRPARDGAREGARDGGGRDGGGRDGGRGQGGRTREAAPADGAAEARAAEAPASDVLVDTRATEAPRDEAPRTRTPRREVTAAESGAPRQRRRPEGSSGSSRGGAADAPTDGGSRKLAPGSLAGPGGASAPAVRETAPRTERADTSGGDAPADAPRADADGDASGDGAARRRRRRGGRGRSGGAADAGS